jgi:uncharacterized protein
MSRALVDVNIPMYAAGAEHRLRDPARQVIRSIAANELDAVTDAEVFQEILYRYLHIGEREKGLRVFDAFRRIMLGRILPVLADDVHEARLLSDRYPRLSARDLIHLAIMRNNGIDRIITADADFEDISGIERIDPMTLL